MTLGEYVRISRPLDFLSSIKHKLGAVIVAAVGVAVVVIAVGVKFGVWPYATVALAGILALSVVQVLARGMISPLREMSAAAKAMAGGNYSRRVTATSRDEVGELARAFNAMASELAETDRVRRDLVANVSHELRTPITALQALLENMLDGVQSADPQTLCAMLGQVQRLGRLVSQLLDLSRLESGVIPLHSSWFSVPAVFDQAVKEAKLQAPSLRFETGVSPEGLRGYGDAERVHQVVANLLSNAIRHAPESSSVGIKASAPDGALRIEVTDSGSGIPGQDLARVFERFYRTDTARTSEDGGTGLGLAICKWIVDLHGGRIRAESNNPGCRVIVTLPLPVTSE